MEKNNLKILLASVVVCIALSGCTQQPEPVKNDDVYLRLKSIIGDSSDESTMAKIKKFTEVNHHTTNEDVQSQMLIDDADYINANKQRALIENKKRDISLTRPTYLEPLFSKVEIFPYSTKDGIYHEQQSVWIKIKDGEIALKTNDESSVNIVDQFINVLDR